MTAATLSERRAAHLLIIAARLRPIWPKPSSTTSMRPPDDAAPAMRGLGIVDRRWASPACFASTTTEMLSSELP
jgi:hypothetical protein